MKTCPRCGYSFTKEKSFCHKCGYDPLRPSLSKQKENTSKGKIVVGTTIIIAVILISTFIGFGM